MPTSGGLGIWLGLVSPFIVGQILLACIVWGNSGSLDGSSPTTGLATRLPEAVLIHLPGLWERSGQLWVLLGSATILMLLGLTDDRRGLDWKIRIAVQTLVAIVTVAAGFRMSIYVDLPWLTGVLSVIWIVGLVNTFNMLDNMDALSAGTAAIGAAMLAAVMFITDGPDTNGPQLFVGSFLLMYVGSLLGFLWFNRPPARLFMGDAGSYFIGYILAASTLAATFSGTSLPRHAILAPLCILAVPLYDTVTVVFIRLKNGKSPFEGDNNHFSHRLVDLGLSKPQAVATIYLATATCGLGALLLHQVSNIFGAIIILLIVACVLVLIAILESVARREIKRRDDDS
jgi:UDP-GlcNAc:undecaprenyl-phosphate/decaprenyl-phosphate GlcNAc-1-phosphate transferase